MNLPESSSARRHRSRQQLLEVIRRENGVTRSDLSLLTGLSRSAVAEAVQDLLNERLIAEDVLAAGGKGSGRGRPSALLVATGGAGVVVGIDLDHHRVTVAIATTDGQIRAEEHAVVDVDHEPAAALDVAAGMVHRLLGQTGLSLSEIRAVAAGIPAPLDIRTNRIHPASALSSWVGLDPALELSNRLGRRVVIGNDADLGAAGELRFGAAKGARDFLYVKASEGIGAGLVLGGSTYHGATGVAGEIGHTRLGEQGAGCRCGNRGCLETVVSSTLVRQLMSELGVPRSTDESFPLADAAKHPVAGRFIAEAGRTLGRVLADLCNCLNPGLIVLGGELGTAGEPLADGVRESINRFAQPATAAAVEIKIATLGRRAELLGAVSLAGQHAMLEI
jgi:predicted NBD/HSP70 family sugar kinase